LYINDFDKNGVSEQILCFYKDHVNTPFLSRDELVGQIPVLKTKFPTYRSYSLVKSIEDIFDKKQLEKAQKQVAYTFSTCVFENLGDNSFKMRPLPVEANFAPVYSILADDFDSDGNVDLLLGGNLLDASLNLGLYDASYGVLLKGDGKGGFKSMSSHESGILVKGQIRDIKRLKHDGRNLYLIARNNDKIVFYR